MTLAEGRWLPKQLCVRTCSLFCTDLSANCVWKLISKTNWPQFRNLHKFFFQFFFWQRVKDHFYHWDHFLHFHTQFACLTSSTISYWYISKFIRVCVCEALLWYLFTVFLTWLKVVFIYLVLFSLTKNSTVTPMTTPFLPHICFWSTFPFFFLQDIKPTGQMSEHEVFPVLVNETQMTQKQQYNS